MQARDVFDIFVLSSQCADWPARAAINEGTIQKALERVSEVSFGQFRDTVVSYLSAEDQGIYNNPASWEEIQKRCVSFIEEARKGHA